MYRWVSCLPILYVAQQDCHKVLFWGFIIVLYTKDLQLHIKHWPFRKLWYFTCQSMTEMYRLPRMYFKMTCYRHASKKTGAQCSNLWSSYWKRLYAKNSWCSPRKYTSNNSICGFKFTFFAKNQEKFTSSYQNYSWNVSILPIIIFCKTVLCSTPFVSFKLHFENPRTKQRCMIQELMQPLMHPHYHYLWDLTGLLFLNKYNFINVIT